VHPLPVDRLEDLDFDAVGNNASGGVRMQTPKQVVDTALSALDRRTPPSSVAVGRANRFFLVVSRLISRKRIITIIGNLTNATPDPVEQSRRHRILTTIT
jgi:hypothetical protein